MSTDFVAGEELRCISQGYGPPATGEVVTVRRVTNYPTHQILWFEEYESWYRTHGFERVNNV